MGVISLHDGIKQQPSLTGLIKLILFLTMCVVFAFSNIRNLSIAVQFIFVALMFFYAFLTRKKVLSIHFVWMAIFITWSLFVTLFAYDSIISINEIINITLKLLFYTSLIIFIDDEHKFHFVLKSLAVAGLILCLRVISLTPIDALGVERIGRSMNLNPNAIGISLTFSCIASVYLGKKLNNKYYYLLIVPFVIIVLLTGSRKAIISIVGGVSLFVFLSLKKKNKLPAFILILLSGWVLYEALMNIPVLYNAMGKRLLGASILFSSSIKMDASTLTRKSMIEEALLLFKERPIIGHGLESFRIVSSFCTYSHNNYMELLSATGIIGLIIYYSLPFGVLCYSIVKSSNKYTITVVFITIILIMDMALVSYNHLMVQTVLATSTAYFLLSKKGRVLD